MKGEKIMEIPVLEQVKKSLERGELEELDAEVKQILADLKTADQKCTPTQLCSVLLKEVEFQRAKVEKLNLALEEKKTERPTSRYDRPVQEEINIDFKKNPDAQRFFINIGELDGINKSTLMDYICENVTTVSRDDFSDSYTKDKFSFFELSKEKTDDVMSAMNTLTRSGREVHVELSEKRRDTRGGARGGFRSGGNDRRPTRSFSDRRPSFGGRDDNRSSYSRDSRPSFGDRDGGFGGRSRSFEGRSDSRSSGGDSYDRKPRYKDYSDDENASKPKRSYPKKY
jgi:hypothetical protein